MCQSMWAYDAAYNDKTMIELPAATSIQPYKNVQFMSFQTSGQSRDHHYILFKIVDVI